ncbi:alpha-tubulin N-acetyltransferase 1 isoform X3 [Solea solea]|uniref:alpha-tubulin N-acetyltransferase 1 isoform X3 n=1 Tax=Solea solea TaxID=90069 RepID=UPI00272B4DF8|nr:alpha-tubulin N-acetyltransferase 1 isoform X3 [Solea solea]
MEFSFDINHLFPERVSILDHSLVAENRKSAGRPDLLVHVATVIDEMGRASAKAQQLPAPITSASKLQSQRHHLYLLKDREGNGGHGVVVGFLKVGCKKLFLLDRQGAHIEAEPLCVLDFYVAENVQRHGYGLELFNFMLQHKGVEPVLMAYDRPSPKFLSFLGKHYCLTQSVPQVNNFVVFEGFFLNRTAAQLRKTPLKKPEGDIKPYSITERDVVHQEQRVLPWPFVPQSPQRLVSSQCSRSHSVGSSPSRAPPRVNQVSALGVNRDQSPQSPLIERCRVRRTSQQGLVARCSLYSRHLDSRGVGLLDGQLPGPIMVEEQSHAPGHTDTYRLGGSHTTQRRLPPLLFPPLSSSKKDDTCGGSKTSLKGRETRLRIDAEACAAAEATSRVKSQSPQRSAGRTLNNQRLLLEKENDTGPHGWSWTVGKNCYTAQWVKQKHEYRSTRPW